MSERVLVLCTANRIRSVLFAALLRRYLVASGWDGRVAVSSAGILEGGVPPEPETVTAAARFGLDVREHRSRQLDRDIVDSADLIVGAERNHVAEVWALRHDALPRTFTYAEFAGLAATAPARRPGEHLDRYVRRVAAAGGTREIRAVMAEPVVLDVADPVGRPSAEVLAVAAELDRLAAAICASVWPA